MFCYRNVKQVAILKGCLFIDSCTLWAPSIQTKILEILVRNQMERTIPVRLEQIIWDHLWKWSTLTSLVISVGQTKMSVIPFDKIAVPSTALLYPGSSTTTKCAVPWLGSVEPEYTVPLCTWNFQNFKPKFFVNGKHPFFPTRQRIQCLENITLVAMKQQNKQVIWSINQIHTWWLVLKLSICFL